MKINWKEVFKFLSGVMFAGEAIKIYLYFNNIPVPFLGYTVSPELLGIGGLVQFILFLVFFYFGYLRKES